ncbi:MAG TPA: HAD domain-containing protein [Burkholderiaceae bacterium]|nr:HAD domain-containing protein [Burkholderiaceae bacterium]
MIVFLDFDGVLHPDPCPEASRLFENAPRLAVALDDFPQVALVLSTAWRQGATYEQLLMLLPPLLRERVIGVTPNFADFAAEASLVPYQRQAECLHWMRQSGLQHDDWIALDDRPSGFTPYCENLIGCNPKYGFDASVSARLRSALERHFQGRGHAVDLLIG